MSLLHAADSVGVPLCTIVEGLEQPALSTLGLLTALAQSSARLPHGLHSVEAGRLTIHFRVFEDGSVVVLAAQSRVEQPVSDRCAHSAIDDVHAAMVMLLGSALLANPVKSNAVRRALQVQIHCPAQGARPLRLMRLAAVHRFAARHGARCSR